MILINLGDQAGSLAEQRKAIGFYERLAAAHPDVNGYLANVSFTYIGLAVTSYSMLDWPAVVEYASKALPFLESQYNEDRSVSGRLDWLSGPLRQMAEAYARLGDFTLAIETRWRLVRMREEFAALDVADPRRAMVMAEEISYLAPVLWDAGDRQSCLDAIFRATAILDRYPTEKLQTVNLRRELATAYGILIQQLGSIHEVHTSVVYSRKVLPLWEELIGRIRAMNRPERGCSKHIGRSR
jgi:hypothetical protein